MVLALASRTKAFRVVDAVDSAVDTSLSIRVFALCLNPKAELPRGPLRASFSAAVQSRRGKMEKWMTTGANIGT